MVSVFCILLKNKQFQPSTPRIWCVSSHAAFVKKCPPADQWEDMRREIASVVFFLKRLINITGKVEPEKLDIFLERLVTALHDKFKGHWYTDCPSKGQAFRCIRINITQRVDPELMRACRESGVRYADLGLPRELTLWVDPGEVVCRYGETRPVFTIASFSPEEGTERTVKDVDLDTTKKVIGAVDNIFANNHSSQSSEKGGGSGNQRCRFPSNTRRSLQLSTNICIPTRQRQSFSGPIHTEPVVKLNSV
ncbi:protein BTG3-like [Engraulis encrasicolus]|uniref:protein BTG3-like n=1 Tax=Engraulis encrasicolus TaxID=184585 RepID=UPI002FCEA4F2